MGSCVAREEVDAMVGTHMKGMVVSLVAAGALALPAVTSAQDYRYGDGGRQSLVVRCAPGQRAVMSQRQTYRGSQTVARCVGSRRSVEVREGRRYYARSDDYGYRPVARRSRYYNDRHRRSKTKTTLMIAGSAATGAGVGGALKGKKGALIGAAIGGGAASIYEAAKRR
jgi:hypothetical protein